MCAPVRWGVGGWVGGRMKGGISGIKQAAQEIKAIFVFLLLSGGCLTPFLC